jgi:hypothetical protein
MAFGSSNKAADTAANSSSTSLISTSFKTKHKEKARANKKFLIFSFFFENNANLLV